MRFPTNADRFRAGSILLAINHPAVAESLVRTRMAGAQQTTGLRAPYPTWPFAVEAFQNIQGLSPRQILKFCYAHRKRCLTRGEVTELHRLSVEATEAPASEGHGPAFSRLDALLDEYRRLPDPAQLLEEKADDECLGPLLETAARAAVLETELPATVDGVVDVDFQGKQKNQPLHARFTSFTTKTAIAKTTSACAACSATMHSRFKRG